MNKKFLFPAFLIVGIFFLVQFQNCGKGGEGLNVGSSGGTPGPGPGSAQVNMVYTIAANNTQPCNTSTSQLTQQLTGAGPSAKGCVAYVLTAPNRLNESNDCNSPAKFGSLSSAPGWSYNPATDTWTCPTVKFSAIGLVPGSYTMWTMGSDGTTMRQAPGFALTNPASPNNCN